MNMLDPLGVFGKRRKDIREKLKAAFANYLREKEGVDEHSNYSSTEMAENLIKIIERGDY